MNAIVGAGRLPDILSEREITLLTQLEADIEANLKGFKKVGYALKVIRDQQLYRVDYDTFEDYCRDVWDMGRPHAYRLIDSYTVIENLSPMGDKDEAPVIEMLPTNERQARPLSILSPEEQVEAWTMAIDTAKENGGKITASLVEQCVNSLRQKKARKAINRVRTSLGGQDILPIEIKQAVTDLIQLAQRETADENWVNSGKKALISILEELVELLTEA